MAVTGRDGTSRAADAGPLSPRRPLPGCRAREVLHRVGDKWSVYVIDRLGQGSQRFSELRRNIDGITGRMLTVTLRGLERDGLVTRTIHPVIPPRVDYELTPMGTTLLQTIEQLIDWADSHVADIDAARAEYDARQTPAGLGECGAEASACEAEAEAGTCEPEAGTCDAEAEAAAPCDPAEPGGSDLAGAAGLCAGSAVATAETAHDGGGPGRHVAGARSSVNWRASRVSR